MTAVRYEYDAGLATITWADGDRGNSLTEQSSKDLLSAVLAAKADGARVILLRAEGRFFSVGGDLGGMAKAADPGPYVLELAEGAHRFITELVRSDAIVVCAVHAMAAGIGFPIAAAADLVIAAEEAKFSLAYVKVGLSPDGGSSQLVHTLGLHRVLRMALLADVVTARELYDAGLVARLVPAAELDATVAEVVGTLLAGPSEAQAAAKHLIRTAVEPAPEAALRREAQAISRLAGSADGREGIAAFLEKRPPAFS